ncbi:nucleotidyltransferase domain-containing protein [soil metagenome]
MERVTPADSIDDALDELQKRVMRRVLAEEEAKRAHLVVYLSGAHAYGFPSPDSDLDLKAIHVARATELLDFAPPNPTFDRAEVIDAVEIDYTSNELAHALAGILDGNGNYIERVLGRMVAQGSPLLVELRPLVRRALSRRAHRHYRGFAMNQLRSLERRPTVKALLYVLRTALTGIHLLETGELETDLIRLAAQHDLDDALELVRLKRAGERVALDETLLTTWRPRVEALFVELDEAKEASALPEAPDERELRDWMLDVRRRSLG